MNAVAELKNASRETAALAAHIRDLCGEDDQAFADTLDGETNAVEAARRVVRWMNEQEASEAAMKGLAEAYTARARVFATRQAGARAALLQFMGDMGAKSLPLPEATLTAVAGVQQLVGDADPTQLPDGLQRWKCEPDRAAIKAALQAGRTVEGYSLSNAQPRLQVRSR